MHNSNDRQCKECICAQCELRGTDECLDGPDTCDKCPNEDHVAYCPWFDGEC